MSKTYTELIEEISQQEINDLYEYALLTEKNMSKDEVEAGSQNKHFVLGLGCEAEQSESWVN